MPYGKKTKRRPSITRKARITAVACLVSALGLVLLGISLTQRDRHEQVADEAAAYNSRVTVTPEASAQAPRSASFIVIGDSITAADSPDISAGMPGAGSWVSYATEGVSFEGGWAQPGSTTDRMAENVPATKADVAVILAGTNDVAQGLSFERSAANLRRIASGTEASRIVVSAIPPFDRNPAGAGVFNEELSALASAEGWTFVDPMDSLRDGDSYRAEMTEDGVHPTPKAAKLIGESILPAIVG